MMTATAAAEYKANLGYDFTLADALDPEYLEDEPTEDEAERQRISAAMRDWFGM